MPKIQFAMYYLLIILLPLAMILLFTFTSIFTDMWQTLVAPWLLACVVNNLILSTYVNWLIFIPIVEVSLQRLAKEQHLEAQYLKSVG